MGRSELWHELEEIYADLGRELATLRPLCQTSGRCCRFKAYGHQLWTTRLELEYLVEHAGLPAGPPPESGTCPYLKDGLCSVRDHRMLGCRIYYCDSGYAAAMGPLYEKYHTRIKELHRRHGEPYRYGELLASLPGVQGDKIVGSPESLP
jgi:Fe-S-cluster containining protein